ncbi:MAG TPA: 3-phosphoglycerate dehydrogenase [Porphyromonadaceae bacterium]|jgi:D-3-phosphoglycerate dehydrogenase|nr:3-phosphoglycerate dehydrogenase [Porphyromonadaceae bacterium]HBL34349.1 3-phosphoglycerate dehydrogenase [Porphyromonadaceae bacterium]HBX20186.1 3-phosphoglycerate dehydrogenase [Porphyromonadaceae bacterium]HCM19979.1 3-phosphoglycerate dehydrogenase [Porphyromonadaceae bacterium]
MKVLLATEKPFAPQAVKEIKGIIETAGYTFAVIEKYTHKSELIKALEDVDALIIRSDKIDKEVIDHAPQLKVIVRAGAGYDNVDLNAATQRDICVMNTPGQNANAVAELVLGLIIFMQRNQFDGTSGHELKRKRLGLYAFGNVAKMVAKIARGFEMSVQTYSPSLTHDDLRKEGEYGVLSVYSVEELFETSDILSLHMPLLKETRECVNYALLSRLPEEALLVNTARKEVIKEADLIRIMDERPGFRFITDIQPDNHALFKEKFGNRYFSTPKKSGAQTFEANINAGLAAAKQIVDFFHTGTTRFRVN